MSVIQNKKFQLMAIGLASALMGIGQNGLLVSLPFLVEQSAFSLPTWSILIAVGSLLFLPSAPFWGRYSDKHGPRKVVIQALVGMAISFALLCFSAMFSSSSSSSGQTLLVCFIGLLVARIIYGCTVSGMVPASQHWALLLCGKNNRLQAITSVSIGLSAGRLIGPLISILVLKLSPFAPLMVMILLPCVALVGAMLLPAPKMESGQIEGRGQSSWLPNKALLPFLSSGLLLCAAVALLQYSFTPLIYSVTHWPTDQLSDAIGILLTISAACTFATQILVIKKRKLTPFTMYTWGSFGLVTGFLMFLIPNVWVFGVAMMFASGGAALLVPAYTLFATEKQSDAPGAAAGYLSMSHTTGYGVASLLAFTSTLSPVYPIYLCIVFAMLILAITYSVKRKTSADAVEQPQL
ncbi:MFS transporter [Vibrio splendidus]|uniref:MFS transporter n=1 Tax=Vibrio splendidus TaxID=29497 RepID=UPI00049237FE|nr:MFS transporter [Vibrio splendidus]OED79113.1 permease [Vibrio splendidus ZF-90]PTP37891.1 MFS transporter [Vibrio splendidus]